MKITKENAKSILLLAICIIIFFAVVWNLSSVVSWIGGIISIMRPLIIGVCISFILNILMMLFEDRVFFALKRTNKKGKSHKKLARILSIISTLVVFFGAISLLILVIVPHVVNTTKAIIAGFPAFTERALVFTKDFLERFDLTSDRISEIVLGGEHFMSELGEFLKNNMNHLMSYIQTIGNSIISIIVSIFFGLFIAIYLLVQKDLVLNQLRRLARAVLRTNAYKKLTHVLHISVKSFANFISGQLIEACILGGMCFIGMLIFGFPYKAVVSVLVGVTALVPILGAWIGCILSAFLILINDPIKAFWFIIFFLVLQQIEGNLIYPRVVGRQVGLPGVWVLLSVMIGNGFFGALGALVAVPVSSVVYTLLSEYVTYREHLKYEVRSE